MAPRAVMVTGIQCDCCRSVYVLEPDAADQFDQLRGDMLTDAAWPLAERAGWRPTAGPATRCPSCFTQHGDGPAPDRKGWRDVLYRRTGTDSAGENPA